MSNPLAHYRNLGTFTVSYATINGSPAFIKQVMRDCIVLGAHRDNIYQHVSYLVMNDELEHVPFGSPIPDYVYAVLVDKGTLHVEWQKVGKRKHLPEHPGILHYVEGDGFSNDEAGANKT